MLSRIMALLVMVWWLWPVTADACPLVRDVTQDVNGNVIPGVTVTAFYAGTTNVAQIFETADCLSEKQNPVSSGSNGEFEFYMPDGEILLHMEKAGYTFQDVARIAIYDKPAGVNTRSVAFFRKNPGILDLCASGDGAVDRIGATVLTLLINEPTVCSASKTLQGTANVRVVPPGKITVSTGQTLTILGRVFNETGGAINDGTGTLTLSDNVGVKSYWFDASSLVPDGTQCAAPANVTLNGGPVTKTIVCTDNDAATIYGKRAMPPDWDAGPITFTLAYVQTAADTSALNSDMAAQCRGPGETVSNAWGAEVALDDTNVTGSNGVDQTPTATPVTPTGTCAAGDVLWFRWQADAAGTTTAMGSLNILGITMQYRVKPGNIFQ